MRRDERDDVAPAKSPLSTSAVRKPRSAASRAIPAPVIPPPMTSTSTGSAAIDASARARVRCENGVSAGNSPPLRADASFPPGAKGECNAGWKRTDRKSTRLNSSHLVISYAVFCLKKKKIQLQTEAEEGSELRAVKPATHAHACRDSLTRV